MDPGPTRPRQRLRKTGGALEALAGSALLALSLAVLGLVLVPLIALSALAGALDQPRVWLFVGALVLAAVVPGVLMVVRGGRHAAAGTDIGSDEPVQTSRAARVWRVVRRLTTVAALAAATAAVVWASGRAMETPWVERLFWLPAALVLVVGTAGVLRQVLSPGARRGPTPDDASRG